MKASANETARRQAAAGVDVERGCGRDHRVARMTSRSGCAPSTGEVAAAARGGAGG